MESIHAHRRKRYRNTYMDMVIKKATKNDAGELGYIHASSWHSAYKGVIPDAFLSEINPGEREEAFISLITSDAAEYYLFSTEDREVGMAAIGRQKSSDTDTLSGEIHAFYFLEDSWGSDIARQALMFCLGRLKDMGFQKSDTLGFGRKSPCPQIL